MQVETYEVEEINSSEAATMAADSEAMELTAKLGLSGQIALSNPETVTRNPYRVITAEELAIFSVLFPNKTSVEEYQDGIIPLRVLQVLAHAKETQMFKAFHVWHPAKGQADPVLVGLHERPYSKEHTWTVTDTFLLARWGESLLSLDQLREKATAVLKAKWACDLKRIASSALSAQENLSEIIDAHLRGVETTNAPSFNW